MPEGDMPTHAATASASPAGGDTAAWLIAAALSLAEGLERAYPDHAPHLRALDPYRAVADQPSRQLVARLLARETAARTDAPPLARAAAVLGLTPAQRLAFHLCALAEEDGGIAAMLAGLQGGEPYPTSETLGRVLAGPDAAPGAGHDLLRPLVAAGLLAETRADGPRARRGLSPVALAWDLARGAAQPSWPAGLRLAPRSLAGRPEDLCHAAAFRDRLARLAGLMAQGSVRFAVLRHMPGADIEAVAAALARAQGRDLLIVPDPSAARAHLPAAVLLTGALPLLVCDPGPGQVVPAPDLGHDRLPAVLALGRDGGLDPEAAAQAVSLELPFPGPAARQRAWRQEFGRREVPDINEIRDRVLLPLGHLRRVARTAMAEAALAGQDQIGLPEVRRAASVLGREQLDGLAERLPPGRGWDALVVPAETRQLLEELAARCRHREALPDAAGSGAARGVRALFPGPSGTGKTLAARLIGGEIGMDVYRVDLSAVVDKYVGETEKRLSTLFARAEALDVVLLIDEGDGLMARRTEVKSANDRFANLETNFLLQRLESHAGIVLVTTNMPEGIDPAFQRRMDVVVPFPRPAAEARLALWLHHLGAGHAVTPAVLDRVARQAMVTGGQIRNAVRGAAAAALSEAMPIGDRHLLHGLERELQKTGAIGPRIDAETGGARGRQALAGFAGALAGRSGDRP